jgi:hypothetical protein
MTANAPTTLQRHLFMDVDASPYTQLFQTHSATTRGFCIARKWVLKSQDGTFSLTAKGQGVLSVDA